jgi:gas vesicle protein
MSARNGLFTGILIGSLVGAGVALLTAPRSGEETRTLLKEKGSEIKAKAATTLEDGHTRLMEIRDRGQALVAEKREDVKTAFQEIRAKLRAPAGELEDGGENERLQEAAA